VAQLSQVIEMSDRIAELIVKGLRRGGNITEPISVQIQTGSIGEAVTWLIIIIRCCYANTALKRNKISAVEEC